MFSWNRYWIMFEKKAGMLHEIAVDYFVINAKQGRFKNLFRLAGTVM